jgi:endonuclease/exonuclease/phosphatase family metal-dependent hydrolase
MRVGVRRLAAALLALLGGCGDGSGPARQPDLTVAQLNVLHGITGACATLANCRIADRADLLFQWIAERGCPDVVTLQEVWREWLPLLEARAQTACPFVYELALGSERLGVDEEAVLSRYPVLLIERQALFPGFRKVLHVRIDHPLGGLDVYTTHLASGSDGGPLPCDAGSPACPAHCTERGARIRRDCQALEMVDYIEATRMGAAPAVISGDLNSAPGSFAYRAFTERDWRDVYLAAGNAECDPSSGSGCTSGREDGSLVGLEAPASGQTDRIDFIFLAPPGDGFPCHLALDPASDRDGDGTATRRFAELPNPFAASCGPAPLPICWPSDHTGVEMDLNCR